MALHGPPRFHVLALPRARVGSRPGLACSLLTASRGAADGRRSANRGPTFDETSHGRAQAAHEAEQRLRAQLEQDLAATQRRLEAAEKARDTAIKTLEQAATRGTTSRKPQR